MKLYIGSDHAGFEIKEKLKSFVSKKGHEVVDCGAYELIKGDDYPDYAFKVAEKVVSELGSRGLLVCGSGAGVCVAANKVGGARAAAIHDINVVTAAQADDDINILCIGARFISFVKAKKVVDAWLKTDFKNVDPYTRRVNKISNYEK
jgi:ribose 5-phosphate isomerase B